MLLYITKQDPTKPPSKSRFILLNCKTTKDLLEKIESFLHIRQELLIVTLKHDLANVPAVISRSASSGDGSSNTTPSKSTPKLSSKCKKRIPKTNLPK
jgi:hypothetical protein